MMIEDGDECNEDDGNIDDGNFDDGDYDIYFNTNPAQRLERILKASAHPLMFPTTTPSLEGASPAWIWWDLKIIKYRELKS